MALGNGIITKNMVKKAYKGLEKKVMKMSNGSTIEVMHRNKPKKNILQEADHFIHHARPGKYGEVKQSYKEIATILTIITKKPWTEKDVCYCLIAMKLVRESYCHQRDNLVDTCGYLGLLGDLNGGA